MDGKYVTTAVRNTQQRARLSVSLNFSVWKLQFCTQALIYVSHSLPSSVAESLADDFKKQQQNVATVFLLASAGCWMREANERSKERKMKKTQNM